MPWFMRVLLGIAVLMSTPDLKQAIAEQENPPYQGTIFHFKNLVKPTDPSSYRSLRFVERTERMMFDRRINKFETFAVFRFAAEYSDLPELEIDVNQEFDTQQNAQQQAEKYATAFGKLPKGLRREIQALHIQAGDQLFGGGRHVLIHTEQGEKYIQQGILEETLIHEAGHALDRKYARDPQWLTAQKQDGKYISSYAKDNPFREDIAESLVPYLAVQFRADRFPLEQRKVIQETIPHRIQVFNSWNWDGFPKAD